MNPQERADALNALQQTMEKQAKVKHTAKNAFFDMLMRIATISVQEQLDKIGDNAYVFIKDKIGGMVIYDVFLVEVVDDETERMFKHIGNWGILYFDHAGCRIRYNSQSDLWEKISNEKKISGVVPAEFDLKAIEYNM
jgi:hypothetical protein